MGSKIVFPLGRVGLGSPCCSAGVTGPNFFFGRYRIIHLSNEPPYRKTYTSAVVPHQGLIRKPFYTKCWPFFLPHPRRKGKKEKRKKKKNKKRKKEKKEKKKKK
jgi:hypothetical protein